MNKIILSLVVYFLATVSFAQNIEMIVPFPPGGPVDSIARAVRDELQKTSPYEIAVINRPGADGNIAAAEFLNSKTGTNKILIATTGSTLFNKLAKKTSNTAFDPIDDLQMIGPVAVSSTVIVVPVDSPFQNLKELVAHSREHWVSCGTSNTMATFFTKTLAAKENLKINVVPFRGSADVSTNLLGKHIDCAVDAVPQYIELSKANRVRVIALSSADMSNNFKAPIAVNDVWQFDNFYAIALPIDMDSVTRKKIVLALEGLRSNTEFNKNMNFRGFGLPKINSEFTSRVQKDYQTLTTLKNTLNLDRE
jgi:tripartite-type tricarboxylate transporter receptor subunit TctC